MEEVLKKGVTKENEVVVERLTNGKEEEKEKGDEICRPKTEWDLALKIYMRGTKILWGSRFGS